MRRRIEAGIAQSEGTSTLLTLTSRPGTTVEEMMRAWGAMLRWLRREGWSGAYAAVKEFGSESGMLHLHVVCLDWRYVHWKRLRAKWEQLTGAHQVDVQAITDAGARRTAGYVAKYVSKAVGVQDVRKKVTYSRGFPKLGVAARWVYVSSRDWMQGPPSVAQASGVSILVERVTPGCDCVGALRFLDLVDHGYLRALMKKRPPLPGRSGGRSASPG